MLRQGKQSNNWTLHCQPNYIGDVFAETLNFLITFLHLYFIIITKSCDQMWQWLPKRLSHNTTISKLQPSLLKSGRPLWMISFIGSFAVFGLSYSIHGFVQDIFPNL